MGAKAPIAPSRESFHAGASQVIVVGAGPGGLAAAAELGRAGVSAVVLERADVLGASWRGHYDRLHLHTVRWLSALPGLSIPRREGPWVSRDGFVAYLEAYARHHRLDVQTGTEVRRLKRASRGWRLETSRGEVSAPAVVLATGQCRAPRMPAWPGQDRFRGRLLHSSAYRSGKEFVGKDVLVVGAGNSGAEIAVDLVEQGAARVRVSVRRAPHVVPRRVAGVLPTQLVSIALFSLPVPLADALARAAARLTVGDLTRFGLESAKDGLYSRNVRDGKIPILDVGFIAALRAGRLEIVPAVEGFDGAAVLLRGGTRVLPEVVVAATGFSPALQGMLDGLGLLDEKGIPTVEGAAAVHGAPGLHLLGFSSPPTGNLRKMGRDARRIARAVRARLNALEHGESGS